MTADPAPRPPGTDAPLVSPAGAPAVRPDSVRSDADRPDVARPDAYVATLGHLPVVAVCIAALSWLMAATFKLGNAPTIVALALFALLAGLVVATTPLPRGGIGAGNRVTLARIVLICVVGSAIGAADGALTDQFLWRLVPIAILAALLDALDGAVARSTGSVSAFGARLDMEADALFVLILSLLLWRAGKADAWVIAIGAMRYAFLAAGAVLPALRGALPASRRRQTVCVVQIVVLIVGLVPFVPMLASSLLAAAALALLGWSFAVDIVWLWRHGVATATAGKTGGRS